MMITGLCSVSFRKYGAEQIACAARAAGLSAVEWGGDIHAPAGDAECAARVAELTRAAGLCVSSYGSYYRLGCNGTPEEADAAFSAVLDSAAALGAGTVRIWAGNRGSALCSAEERLCLMRELYRVCRAAADRGVDIALECHSGTLTDDYASSLAVMRELEVKNLFMYWQPFQHRDTEYNLRSAEALCPYVKNIHVFNWHNKEKSPLAEGEAEWMGYLKRLQPCLDGAALLLEFMPGGKLEELPGEALALHKIVRSLN